MTLKSSFSDKFFPRLLGRFYQFNWLTALWSVALFFVFPVAGALIFSIEALTNGSWTVAETSSVLAGQIGTACILSIFMAVLTPNTFNYLNSRKQLDFYHSQPVSRKELFWRNYLVGLFSFLIPLTIGFVLDFGITLLIPGLAWQNVFVFLKGYAVCVGTYFTANALCILAVMLCGNRFISLLTGIYFCGVPAMLFGMVMYFITATSSTFAYESTLYNILAQITPMCYFVDYVIDNDAAFGKYFIATIIWIFIGVGIVFASLGLYLKRKSESAGKSLSFKKAIVFIKYPLTIFVAWVGGLLFNAMGENALWMIFGFATFGILTFCIVGGLEKFEFKNAFRGFGKLAITCVIYVLCVVLIFGCCIAFDRRTTEDKYIKSIDIHSLSYTENAYDGNTYRVQNLLGIEGEEAIKALNYIATLAAKEQHRLTKTDRFSLSGLFGNNIYIAEEDDNSANTNLTVTIHTAFGSYKRQYRLTTEIDGKILKRLETFSESAGAKKAQAEQAFRLINTDVEKFSFIAGNGIPGKKPMQTFYEALEADLKAAKVEDYEANCLGNVYIYYKYAPYYYDSEYEEECVQPVPVYPSFENTLALMKEYGVKPVASTSPIVGSFGTNEYYTDMDYEKGYQLGYDEGYEKGKLHGYEGTAYQQFDDKSNDSYSRGYAAGYIEGYDNGYNQFGDSYHQGYLAGIDEGYAEGEADRKAGDNANVFLPDYEVYTNYINGYHEGYIKGYYIGFAGDEKPTE